MLEATDVIIVGGGVIGICIAYYLAKRGAGVFLIEKDQIGWGCSYGNAGLITPSHSLPLPAPGAIKEVCKWMLQEDSPLLLRARLDWGLFTWLIRFAAKCRQESLNRTIPILRELSLASLELFKDLIAIEDLSFQYEQRGILSVYTTEKGFEKGRLESEMLRMQGFEPKILDGNQARKLEPTLRKCVIGGIYYAGDAHGDCYQFTSKMCRVIQSLGAKVWENTQVTRIVPKEDNIHVFTKEATFCGKFLVLATGSWTPEIIGPLRVRIPIQPGKGYSLSSSAVVASPKIPVMNAARRVVITPFGDRLRFAGTMEFAGMDFTLNERRVNTLLHAGMEIMDVDVSLCNSERWCGLRPCTPDGLPVVGRIPHHPQIFIATGHAMLGYTLGPVTGKLVSEMISGSRTSIDTSALRIDRF